MTQWMNLLLTVSPLLVAVGAAIYGGGNDIDFRAHEVQNAYATRARRDKATQSAQSQHSARTPTKRPCPITRARTRVATIGTRWPKAAHQISALLAEAVPQREVSARG